MILSVSHRSPAENQYLPVMLIPGLVRHPPVSIVLGVAFVCFNCFFASLHAQIDYRRDFYSSQQRNSLAYSAIENLEGNIVLAGRCDVKDKGFDIQIQVLTKEGKMKQNFLLGGLKDDVAKSIVETKDGGYVVAGYTDSKWAESKGGRDAFIIKLNRLGQVQWHHIYGSLGDDEWNQVTVLPSGDLVAVGFSATHPAAITLTSSGVLKWESTWLQLSGRINGVAQSNDQFFFTGVSYSGQSGKMLVGSFAPDGRLSNSKILNEFLEGQSIISLPDGSLVVAGNLFTKTNRQDGVIIKFNPSFTILKKQVTGGRSDDAINSVHRIASGEFIICGYTYSASKGARRSDLWTKIFDYELTPLPLARQYYGGGQEDIGFNSIQLSNGIVWLIGSSFTGLASGVATWIIELHEKSVDLDITSTPLELVINNIPWISGEDDVVDEGEYGYFNIEIKKSFPSSLIHNKITVVSSDKSIHVPDSLVLDFLKPGNKLEITLPFIVTGSLPKNNISFLLKDATGKNYTIPVSTRVIYNPVINFANHVFHENDDHSQISLSFEVRNDGNGYLSQGALYFVTDFKIQPLSDDIIILNQLAPKETKTVKFIFKPNKNYNADSINVHLVLRSDEAIILTEESYSYKIENIVPDVEGLINIVSKNNLPRETPASFQTAVWIRPDPEEGGYKMEHQIPEIDVRIKLISSTPLDQDSIYLSINGLIATPGVVYLPESYSWTQESTTLGYQYEYRNKINLILGENIINLVKKPSGIPITNSPIVIDYTPKRYNLYLISIGVPHDDLQFTAKDAGDLANAFINQEGKLFNKITTHLFNEASTTTTSSLRFAIQDIANDYFLREEIQPGDMIILYISSHGFQLDESDDDFWIAASDFNWLYKPQTSIDFRNDIINILRPLPCKKLILLDACYSGAIADIMKETGQKGNVDPGEIALSKAIARLVQAQNDFQVITSSSPGQRSYEDPLWGNSAFMKGILEAMTPGQTSQNKKSVDGDGDNILYLSEIFNYIKTRIPEIVLTKKPRPTDIQTPWIAAKEEWPIFVYP